MSGWMILGLYAVGYCVCAWRMYPRLLNDSYGVPDTTDKVLSSALALVASLFWPLVLLAALLTHTARPTDAERQAELDEREAEIRERERTIERLERENGIGQ